MTTADVLRKAKALIEENGWCQGSWARNCSGECVAFNDHSAATWCGLGAIRHTRPSAVSGDARRHLFMAAGVLDDNEFIRWNDAPGRTKEDVLAAFDKAIALAESRP